MWQRGFINIDATDTKDCVGIFGNGVLELDKFLDFRGYRIPEVLVGLTGGGATAVERFADISAWHMSQLDRYIGIKETDNVVEIGCGIGRVAIPLSERLTTGQYIGTETIGRSIEWCVNNITAAHPNFQFIHHDIRDDLHNPKGTLDASDIRLPSEDGSVDLIVLHSVFTHMFKDEILHYLKEFRRILKPTGRVWASFFVADQEMIKSIDAGHKTEWNMTFAHPHGYGCRVENKASPRAAVLYDQSVLEDMVADSDLAFAHPILQGRWSGLRPEPKSGQDAVILKPQNAPG